ncbi:unnamed protein product [Effrenium voratum]|nr:unnamed protein product [Effrenium voratum]
MVVDDFELPPPTKATVNREVGICVMTMIVVLGIGYTLDVMMPKPSTSGRPSWLCIATLLGSYVLLVPGLICTLFQFLLGVELLGVKVLLTQVDNRYEPIIESTIGLVGLLFDTGGWIGALLLILYAMVVPALKIGFLILAELWRESPDPRQVLFAKRSIQVVQMISKWACPDMFAYILLLYLFRHLNGAGGIIAAPAQLGIGFACFSIFCVFSTFSTLMVEVPHAAEEVEGPVKPWLLRSEATAAAGVGAFVLFLGIFGLGLFAPTMAMYLDSALLLKPNGPLDESLKPMLDSLHLEELVNAEVTIADATWALTGYIAGGEMNDVFAVLMLSIFVILLPLVNMFCLCMGSWKLSSEDTEGAWRYLCVSRVLKHIEMLDVAIMGIIVVTCAGTAYHKQGVMFSVMTGLWILLLAEVLHYVTHYQVHDSYKYLQRSKL